MSFVGTLLNNRRAGEGGPAPVKGHGPHRYVFQLFAMPATVIPDGTSAAGTASRALLGTVRGPALARARFTGTNER